MRRFCLTALLLMAGITIPSVGEAGLAFNFTPEAGTSAAAVAGFQAGGNRWSVAFSDNITVNITIGFKSLGAGILAQAGSTREAYSYSDFRTAIAADGTSADDSAAFASLPSGTSFNLWLNRTANNPNGSGSATAYLDNDGDANNTTIRMTTANAKALGLTVSASSDATIAFSSSYTWDFDPSDGITPGAFDFVGIATHEIGHALGFISGVDILDINSPPVYGPFNDDAFVYVAPLDMFRYSADSVAEEVTDWTADTRNKYFSLDDGITDLGSFSTGVNFGDGRQASHWKDSLGLGIMDPTSAPGELLAITELDLRAFDVIGYDRNSVVPEPISLAIWGTFGAVGVFYCRRRRHQDVTVQ